MANSVIVHRWCVHPGTAEHPAWQAEPVHTSLYMAAWEAAGRLFQVRSTMML